MTDPRRVIIGAQVSDSTTEQSWAGPSYVRLYNLPLFMFKLLLCSVQVLIFCQYKKYNTLQYFICIDQYRMIQQKSDKDIDKRRVLRIFGYHVYQSGQEPCILCVRSTMTQEENEALLMRRESTNRGKCRQISINCIQGNRKTGVFIITCSSSSTDPISQDLQRGKLLIHF